MDFLETKFSPRHVEHTCKQTSMKCFSMILRNSNCLTLYSIVVLHLLEHYSLTLYILLFNLNIVLFLKFGYFIIFWEWILYCSLSLETILFFYIGNCTVVWLLGQGMKKLFGQLLKTMYWFTRCWNWVKILCKGLIVILRINNCDNLVTKIESKTGIDWNLDPILIKSTNLGMWRCHNQL